MPYKNVKSVNIEIIFSSLTVICSAVFNDLKLFVEQIKEYSELVRIGLLLSDLDFEKIKLLLLRAFGFTWLARLLSPLF